ncbi:D-alanyl-D-alanine carboxypeptidase [Pontibacillus halophilus JSM 076056 = DSM 19796]|uniref:D-alanyl-D-alanine carboxypeptidase n=1 Tax=Pontibacillus halophilus JSM 076056 = DSM 19796 TaxID=1385510 RepID=A0A0A5GM18_9BACI|nr:D-alanyl-D-alanine carboxypeptidase [Pontibacillus halophilus JSM 076056 = DSM 19796]
MGVILILLLVVCMPPSIAAAPSVSARNAVLMEQSTGRVLFEKAGHEQRNIASITKIMTAIIAIESGMLKEKVEVSHRAVYTEGSSVYLKEGQEILLEDLVYGLMLRSGNDAAMAIAEHVGGSMEGFVVLMNEKAEWIGMTNSSFANPHGLDQENHYSTAYDMALLTRYAMDNDLFRKVSRTESYRSKSVPYPWGNKNKMLTRYYEFSTGGKTGFTKSAGRTLVSTAEKDGMELIMVTLNAPDDWNDHTYSFEWGFENYSMKELAPEGKTELPNEEGTTGYLWNEVRLPLAAQEFGQIEERIHYFGDLSLLETGGVIGKKEYYLNGEPIQSVSIMGSPNPERESFMKRATNMLQRLMGFQ